MDRNQRQLIKILEMDTTELAGYLAGKIFKLYGKNTVYTEENYIYAKGEIPIALVAHMDTVFSAPKVVELTEGILTSSTGLGADDRAGIFSILHLLDIGYRPTVIFCNYEESGGIGARDFVERMTKDNLKLEVDFMIELDRKGSRDSVFYDCANTDFEKFINGFGFSTDWGSFSDISTIAPWAGVAAVNLSIGYYYQHTTHEILVLKDMYKTIRKVEKILTSPTQRFEYIESTTWKNWNKDWANYSDWGWSYTTKHTKKSAKKNKTHKWKDDMLELDNPMFSDDKVNEILYGWKESLDTNNIDDAIVQQMIDNGEMTDEDWIRYNS